MMYGPGKIWQSAPDIIPIDKPAFRQIAQFSQEFLIFEIGRIIILNARSNSSQVSSTPSLRAVSMNRSDCSLSANLD
jgi:hypothetical protein